MIVFSDCEWWFGLVGWLMEKMKNKEEKKGSGGLTESNQSINQSINQASRQAGKQASNNDNKNNKQPKAG
jgi:hypothetical protein